MDDSVVEPVSPLTCEEETELGELEDLGWSRTPEQSERYRALRERKCPRGTIPRDPVIQAAFDAFNRGDHEAAEQLLTAIAPPPRAEVEILERRINTALRDMSRQATQRLRKPPVSRKPRTRATRPNGRRATTRARARAPSREPDPDEPADDARPGNRANLVDSEAAIDELLRAQASKARTEVAVTCSYCHSRKRGGRRALIGEGEQRGWWATHSCVGLEAVAA
jgi:hypothetical protein